MQAANSGDKDEGRLEFRAASRNQMQIDSDVEASWPSKEAVRTQPLDVPAAAPLDHEARPEFCHSKIISINLREVNRPVA
jgi:hypothetical protein